MVLQKKMHQTKNVDVDALKEKDAGSAEGVLENNKLLAVHRYLTVMVILATMKSPKLNWLHMKAHMVNFFLSNLFYF